MADIIVIGSSAGGVEALRSIVRELAEDLPASVYTGETLLSEQVERQEAALWAAIRALEERTQLLTKLAQNAEAAGASRLAAGYEERSRGALEDALALRELLIQSHEARAAAVTSAEHAAGA